MRVSEDPCWGARACKTMVPHREHLRYGFQALLLAQPRATESELETNAETTRSNL